MSECASYVLRVSWCCLIFRFIGHVTFSSVCGVRGCSNFIDFHDTVQLPQNPWGHCLSFTVYFCLLCLWLIHSCLGLFLSSLFCSIDLYVCFLPIWCCFDHWSFTVLCGLWEGNASRFVLFLQDCYGNAGSSVIPYKSFTIVFCSSVKNVTSNLPGIIINWKTSLGSMTIILILYTYKHKVSFHSFESSSIAVIRVLTSYYIGLFISYIDLFLGTLFFSFTF